ncbi:MAG: NUDIX domain-containing protein [Planctomycetota bacterium]
MSAFGLDGYYEVLHQGCLPLEAVQVHRLPELGHRWTAVEEEVCEELVARRLRRGERLIVLDDGEFPVLDRLDSFEVLESGEWRLRLGPTHYPAHLLTNVEHPKWREAKGDAVMADALAVCALTTTVDGYAVWGRRAAAIPEGAGRWHVVPAGHPEPPQSMAEALFAELDEELGVAADEVEEATFTGIVRSLPTLKPELTARLRLKLTWDEFEARPAKDAWESEQLVGIKWNAEAVAELLVEECGHAIPSGHAATYLAAAQDFGPEWAEETLAKLRA